MPDKPRRSYGTGTLIEREDSAGRLTYYGKWRSNGRQLKRRIGAKRAPGARDGLTRAQAEKKLRDLMAETPATRPTAERLTLAEVAPRYLRHLQAKGRKWSTLVAAESCLRVWLLPVLGDRAVAAIRGEDVEDLMTQMEAGDRAQRARGGRECEKVRAGDVEALIARMLAGDAGARAKPCGPKTIRNYIGTLSAIYHYAMHTRRRWATANPCDDVDLPEVEGDEDIRFLEPAECEALARPAIDGDYQAIDRALYLTAAMTGLRHGELRRAALARRRLDRGARPRPPELRARRVRHARSPSARRAASRWPTTSAASSTASSSSRASRRDDDLVFADPVTGGPLSQGGDNRRFRKALQGRQARRDAPLPRPAPHLRHPDGRRSACRCGRCRSGWATATSRRRSATPTTRRARTRRR